MKSIVIYYSRTNNTKTVSEILAKTLGSDLRPLVDKNSRKGPLGYMSAGISSVTAKRAKLIDPDYDVSAYDLILIGTPVWAGRPTPAVLTLFDNIDLKGKKVVVFCTKASPETDETLNIMAGYVKKRGGDVVYMFFIKSSDAPEIVSKKAEDFAKQITNIK